MDASANAASGDGTFTVHINDEKHVFDASEHVTESLDNYLRRKTRFKVGLVTKPLLCLALLHVSVCKLHIVDVAFNAYFYRVIVISDDVICGKCLKDTYMPLCMSLFLWK